ncbi:MAG: UDP-N-acetylmuramoyl-L-alanyl-D-glutamate--2,6-diaminopimelate ligase [Acidobacteria bacterium ACB2]|nr:UDP-N-acetylmuramoyl-L-alanyl-D-glutamate--2,6-diaminopimelate ligase [Acidobacteria bacterium ACB2]
MPYVGTDEPRRLAALLSARLAGDPAGRLLMVGVTGTSGKTTTVTLVDRVLAERHPKRGLFGTLAYRGAGGDALSAARTTPEATELQAMLAALVADGGTAATLECSSHALALERLAGCAFDAAVFLNLSRDHLDFHHDLAHYFEAKARLFSMLKPGGRAVVNVADPWGRQLADRLSATALVTFALDGPADVTGKVEPSASGLTLFVERKETSEAFEVVSTLLGRPNAENLLAAAATCLALGLPAASIAPSLGALERVPGRLEAVPNALGLTVLVDYAHKPGALEGVLKTVRPLAQARGGRVVVLFGCGGDRDRGKRPDMGRIAALLADETVLTSDNPRSEDPHAILAEIREGYESTGKGATTIVDRGEAIGFALRHARPGDVVVLAGKGHETYQESHGVKRPFDDRKAAREALALLEAEAGAGSPA